MLVRGRHRRCPDGVAAELGGRGLRVRRRPAGVCASRQPWVPSRVYWLLVVRATPRSPFRYAVLRHGADVPGASPPRFGALVAASGPLSRAAHRFALSPAVHRPDSAWLTAPGPRAFDAGPRRRGGLAGRLFLTRSRGASTFRDLVAFTWRDGGQRRVIAVQAAGSSPRAGAPDRLRRRIRSIPAAAP